MNETQMSAKWLQITGKIKQKWGMLKNDELTQARGTIDCLVGKAKERYAKTRETALHKVNEILMALDMKEKKMVPVKVLP